MRWEPYAEVNLTVEGSSGLALGDIITISGYDGIRFVIDSVTTVERTPRWQELRAVSLAPYIKESPRVSLSETRFAERNFMPGVAISPEMEENSFS